MPETTRSPRLGTRTLPPAIPGKKPVDAKTLLQLLIEPTNEWRPKNLLLFILPDAHQAIKKAYLRDRKLLNLYHFMQQTAEQFSSHIPDLQGASRPFNTRPQGKCFTARTSCDNTPTAIASRRDGFSSTLHRYFLYLAPDNFGSWVFGYQVRHG